MEEPEPYRARESGQSVDLVELCSDFLGAERQRHSWK